MRSKRAAMEMSVGTIVTIVLLMSVLVLGIFLIQRIFWGSQDAVTAINDQVQNEINKLFSEEGKMVVIYPGNRNIKIDKGDDTPAGFAFSINNKDVESHSYAYTVSASEGYDYAGKCGSTMTLARANGYILEKAGTQRVAASSQMQMPELVMFQVPESATACIIPYKLMIDQDGEPFQDITVYVAIK